MAGETPDAFEYGTYFGAPIDGGIPYDVLDAGQPAITPEEFMPDDYDIVSSRIEEFMYELYRTDRYTGHNDRILSYHDQYSREGEESDSTSEAENIDRMAIILHDFVEHAVLNPEKTAAKLGLAPEEAGDIRTKALEKFNEVLAAVGDQDGLIKSYLFAIDTSKWESEARQWRGGAIDRITEMVDNGEISDRNGAILIIAINKTPELGNIEREELKHVLTTPDHRLADLKLEAISEVTLNHNIKGLYFKALETLDLIKHPPADNPASTYRDCTEAINFFVPALMGLGYKQLAIDLRDSSLRWFFDDPNGDAERQHALSEQYFDKIKAPAIGLLEAEFSNIEADTEARIKSEGSLREKLAKEGYESIHQAPDGVGFAFIVPNNMAGAAMTDFAENYRERLTANPRIVPGHPKPAERDFDDMQGERKKDSGYEAVHMTFYYSPAAQPDVRVPFEIQVLTEEQHRLKLYGRFSDLFYKSATEYADTDQPHLEHLEERARAEREIAPGSTVQSIAEMIAVSPEIPSVFNKLFRAVDTENGARILIPPELEDVVRKLPPDVLGASGDLTVLPASRVTESQFLEAISMFGKELATDENVRNALELVKNSEAGAVRDDGSTSVLEGHILPTALSAVMLAIQSGKIWGEEFGPIEHISNIATAALLHDHPEKQLEAIDDKNVDAKIATCQSMLYEIKQKFGQTIRDGVEALTVPVEITDEFQRREQYAENIRNNEYAMLIKPADRWQNHLTDIIKLAVGQVSAASLEGQKIIAYFAKTDRHLSETFTSSGLPDEYARAHNVVWQLAKHFGYKP